MSNSRAQHGHTAGAHDAAAVAIYGFVQIVFIWAFMILCIMARHAPAAALPLAPALLYFSKHCLANSQVVRKLTTFPCRVHVSAWTQFALCQTFKSQVCSSACTLWYPVLQLVTTRNYGCQAKWCCNQYNVYKQCCKRCLLRYFTLQQLPPLLSTESL